MVATAPGQRYCFECGSELVGPAPSPARSPSAVDVPAWSTSSIPQVERRLVSVLFADLTGFTSFSEMRDPEEVRDVLSQYFAAARRIVDSYGGVIEKFIGDAVMALWGAPVAREDDAERAVRAALDLVAAVSDLGDRLGLGLRLRAGVLTGEAAVDPDATEQGKVIGDAINTASRIQSIAEPGSVLVDDVTRSATDRAILYEDGGAHPVKGKQEPVHTWRPLRVLAGRAGIGRTELELPLVGREKELDTIKRSLDEVIEAGASLRLVSVIGDAGLGKSRLAWELKKYADGLSATVLWHHGEALSFGEGVGLAALAQMVRMRAEINLDEPASDQRAKLTALIDDLFVSSEPGERERAARALGRLLGLDDGRTLIDRGELFSSWRMAFERLAARAPVVLLFEDLQWADQGLFDFIAHLSEWAPDARILVLVFSRPDERLDALALLGERLDLAPLGDAEIEALVSSAVDSAPPELLGRVREHAAGVPLFAVESLRMLADRGVMVPEARVQRYRLVGEVRDLDVPPSIHALVAARLDGLGALEHRALLGGAVLGRRFAVTAAAALAGVSEADARSLLGGLVAKQFLTVDTDPRSPSRGTYEFVHIQVQRVALGTLSKRERKAGHLAAVDFLAHGAPDPDLPALLAGHLMAAYEALPDADDAGSIRRRALGLTLDAAERADSVGALTEAVSLFDKAAQIESDEERRADHLTRAAQCAERGGDQEALASGYYAAARELHEHAGRRREALRLRARALYAYRWRRPPAELVGSLREIYEELSDERDSAFADAAASLAGILYADGTADAAEAIAAEAALAAENVGAYEVLGEALNWRGSALIELARPVEALEFFRATLENDQRYAPSKVPGSLGNISVTLAALGRFEEAVATGREAVATAERLASRVNRNLAALHMARALFSLGEWDEALATADEVALATAPANRGMLIGPPALVAMYRGDRERAKMVIDDFDLAEAEAGAAFESDYRSLREVVLAHLVGDWHRAEAVIARAASGDYAEWPTWLSPAIDLLTHASTDGPLHEALAALRGPVAPKTSPMVVMQIERLEALLAARAGDLTGAVGRWRAAIEAAESAGMAFNTAMLVLELAEHVPGQVGVESELQRATGTFDRLRAVPWLTRARAASALIADGGARTHPLISRP
jgi:class 3 adenylate cyclase/tetratricopeptide (TPR) repeat protein